MSLSCPTTASLHAACLPAPLGDLVRCLSDRFDPPGPVCAAIALQAVAAAVGPAAVLRDEPTPPLSPSLNTFIAAPPGSALPLALDIVMAPLRSIQARLGTLSSAEPSRLASVDSRAVPAEERARAAPFIMTEDCSLAGLLASLAASFDGCLLATFTPSPWSRLQNELAATPQWLPAAAVRSGACWAGVRDQARETSACFPDPARGDSAALLAVVPRHRVSAAGSLPAQPGARSGLAARQPTRRHRTAA